MDRSIFSELEKIGLVSDSSRQLFNLGTRDVEDLEVWRDSKSGVIYIDGFYTGDETYADGGYRGDDTISNKAGPSNFESFNDAKRRFNTFLRFVAGKRIADFGCGRGDFLKMVQPFCECAVGIELQRNYIDELNSSGISCTSSLESIEDSSLDTIVSFHVIEHLPNPLESLELMKRKIVSEGCLLIEVPHANDFLLSMLSCNEFKQFTLWSQHLVLHTRDSLRRMLEYAGFRNVLIEGVQRFPLSNHLGWLSSREPGGHKSSLSFLDCDVLHDAYQNALARIDCTDTLVAVARVP